ncbi:hypothetical protein JTB14_012624 [Gonioctena quinquepunctata]|nr:hypothetical protein JTB14_012624 [Gonioctena quinquepunctata]
MSKQKENRWSNYALRIIVNTASHPFEYAKVLIQIGYEPIAPRPAKTLFGKPALKLPNIFEYVKHIKTIDGFQGCYVGLVPKVTGNLLSAVVTQRLSDYLEPPNVEDDYEEEEPTEEQKKAKFIKGVKCDLITHTAAIIVSQPFHVITVRMMAQFVGRETRYTGIFGSIREVYQQNGVLGFFSGLVPRLLGDILSLLLASSLTFAINYYVIEEKELKVYTSATMTFLATAITYPFQVVSNCMAVTNSGLAAGSRLMPHYNTWMDCWADFFKESNIMFWKYNTNSSSQIEALLAKEDVTLQEVLEFEDIINECRVQNKLLIDYLQKTEIMEELVTLITKEPSIELEERSRFKYPNIACELLTCDVPALNERLASDEVLLDKLYTFLECDPPLNPLLASYFSKVMGALIAKKIEQVLDFLKAKDTFISLLLKHLGTSAVMDLMLKLMTQVEGVEMRQNILNWLDSQRIMQSLVSLLNPKVEKERHHNVSQLLCDFIRIARDTQKNSTERADPDPLLNTLESPETVSLLLDYILMGDEKSETAIVGGIQVLLALLDVYQSSIPKFNSQSIYSSNINDEASDIEQKQKIIHNTTQAIKERVKDFHDILLDPPKQSPILTTVGMLNPPLGNVRLQITKLYAALISSNNEELSNKIEMNGTFSVLLDLFFKYHWNNFLHTQVEDCLISALKTHVSDDNDDSSNALSKHLLVDCKLIDTILNAWSENDEQQKQERGIRKGYMGHLISIVNKIVELCSTTSLGQYLKNHLPEVAKSLEEFQETTLRETNKIQETLLGGAHPQSSVEENDDYSDVPFPQSSALQQQMFSQYQMQNLASQYIDGYSGFNDDAFNDGDDTLQTIEHRTEMNFDLSEGDLVQQQEIFKQVCAQNINTLDDADDQIFEEREHTFQTVIEKHDRNEAAYSSDSDDELPSGEDTMDVDPWSSPKPTSDACAPVISSDPWAADFSASDATVGGWADFSSVPVLANCVADDSNKKDAAEEADKPALVEKDLKVESIEGEAKVPEVTLTNSINVAQIEEEEGKIERGDKGVKGAGERGDQPLPTDQRGGGSAAEPSKSIKEGDFKTQPASSTTEKEKV